MQHIQELTKDQAFSILILLTALKLAIDTTKSEFLFIVTAPRKWCEANF